MGNAGFISSTVVVIIIYLIMTIILMVQKNSKSRLMFLSLATAVPLAPAIDGREERPGPLRVGAEPEPRDSKTP